MSTSEKDPRIAPRRKHLTFIALWLLLSLSHATPASEAYRWQDRHGTTVYSDTPPVGIASTRLPLDSAPFVARVEHVIDGDTVILRGGERVRLLGINTPEVARRNLPGEPLGEEAREALARLVTGKRVTLQLDQERRDHYGRLLAHLFLEDRRHLNALLLEQGWAHASLHWPNLRYAEEFLRLERQAREAHRGIWQQARYQLQPAERAAQRRNTFARLQGRVSRVEERRGEIRLYFGRSLLVTLAKGRLGPFAELGLPLASLTGQTVVIRGWVGRYRGVPRIILEHPLQLENLPQLIQRE